jgi:hypothetical protein
MSLMKPWHKANPSSAENVYSPEDLDLKRLYEKEPACKEKNVGPLLFCYMQVSLYL